MDTSTVRHCVRVRPRTPLPAGYLDSGDDEAKPRPAVQLGVFGVAYSPVSRLRAVARATTGKRPAQWARTNGLLPSQVYGGAGPPQHIYIAEKDLRALVRARGQSFLSSLVDLELGEGGVVVRVLARDFQMHPFRNKFICCNWVRYTPGRYPGTKVDLPLVAVNEERCPAYRDGACMDGRSCIAVSGGSGSDASVSRMFGGGWRGALNCAAPFGGRRGLATITCIRSASPSGNWSSR